MKNLCIKLNCLGLGPAEVAKMLRDLADVIEAEPETPAGTKLESPDGREVGVIMRPAAPMKLERAKPSPAAAKPHPLARALRLADALRP